MHLRKLLTTAVAAVLISVLFVLPVSAHGHHHQTTAQTDCPVCTVDGCTREGRHTHDGYYYCGYDHEDGYCDGSCETVSRRRHGRHRCH